MVTNQDKLHLKASKQFLIAFSTFEKSSRLRSLRAWYCRWKGTQNTRFRMQSARKCISKTSSFVACKGAVWFVAGRCISNCCFSLIEVSALINPAMLPFQNKLDLFTISQSQRNVCILATYKGNIDLVWRHNIIGDESLQLRTVRCWVCPIELSWLQAELDSVPLNNNNTLIKLFHCHVLFYLQCEGGHFDKLNLWIVGARCVGE